MLKFGVKIFILQAHQSSQHRYEKREGSGPGSGSVYSFVPLNNGSGFCGYGSGSPTLQIRVVFTGIYFLKLLAFGTVPYYSLVVANRDLQVRPAVFPYNN